MVIVELTIIGIVKVSRMYAEVVYNSCRPNEGTGQGAGGSGKENELPTSGVGTPSSALPEVWVSVCRIKDRHYAALAYRYAACALLPYFRCSADVFADRHHRGHRRSPDETDADELLSELTAAAAAAGLDVAVDDDDDDKTSSSSAVAQQLQRCKQIGTSSNTTFYYYFRPLSSPFDVSLAQPPLPMSVLE